MSRNQRLGFLGIAAVIAVVAIVIFAAGSGPDGRPAAYFDYSEYAPFFDINWDPNEERLRHNILIPILGDHYGRVLDKGEIVEQGTPEQIFNKPENDRTKLFLSQILHH